MKGVRGHSTGGNFYHYLLVDLCNGSRDPLRAIMVVAFLLGLKIRRTDICAFNASFFVCIFLRHDEWPIQITRSRHEEEYRDKNKNEQYVSSRKGRIEQNKT